MIKLYGNYKSGNVYKVSLILHLLGKEYQEVQIGLGPNTESQTDEFRAINPLGQIPVLETEDGQYLWQSNAILTYLAQGSELMPDDPFEQAQVMQWLCFEQYELEPNLAWARWICHIGKKSTEMAEDLKRYHSAGYGALDVVEQQLEKSAFIASEKLSVADVALFAYISSCHQGQFDLENYPAINDWLKRIKALDNFFEMAEQFSQFDYQ
jgi:glutathione S-transferase